MIKTARSRSVWKCAGILCLAICSCVRSEWIPLASVDALIEVPTRERRPQAFLIHADYRSEIQRAGSGQTLALRIPWERSNGQFPHDPARFQIIIVS